MISGHQVNMYKKNKLWNGWKKKYKNDMADDDGTQKIINKKNTTTNETKQKTCKAGEQKEYFTLSE